MQDYPLLLVTLAAERVSTLDEILSGIDTAGWQTGEGDPVTVTVYFMDDASARQARDDLTRGLQNFGISDEEVTIETSVQEPKDWETEWRKSLKPIRIGSKWLIRPSWQPLEGYGERTTLIIDPKMAFGSGTHPTTQLCLVELEALVKQGMSVLDVGTGTAILAMAAATMGAMPITGVEIDTDAVRCARENLTLNHLEGNIRLVNGTLDDVPGVNADLIVANIQFVPLVGMSAQLRQRLNRGGTALFSGILESEADAFMVEMEKFGWEFFRRRRQYDPMTSDGWVCFCAK